MTSNWYAAFTRFACERKVAAQLTYKDLTCYLPLNCIIQDWGDREKLIFRPLFPSCVFVKTTKADLAKVRKLDDVISLLYWLNKPAVVDDDDIAAIKRFLSEYVNVRIRRLDVRGVKLIQGSDESCQNNGNNLLSWKIHKVLLPSIGYIMMADVSAVDTKLVKQFSLHRAN